MVTSTNSNPNGINVSQVGDKPFVPDETNLESTKPSGRLYSESVSYSTSVNSTGFLDLTSDLKQNSTFDNVRDRSNTNNEVEYNAYESEANGTPLEEVQIAKPSKKDEGLLSRWKGKASDWISKTNDKHHNWMERHPIAAVATSLTGIGGLINLTGWAVHKGRDPDIPQTPTSVDPGQKFYKTPQGLNRTCAMHASNAFLGQGKIELNDLREARDQVQNRQEQDGLPTKWEGKYSGFTVDTVQQAFHNKGIETDSRSFYLQNNANIGEQLSELSALIETRDEVMVNLGNEKGSAHWVSFRRDSEGSWHLLDSKTSYGNQPIQDPVAYIRDGAKSGSFNAQVVFKHEFTAQSGTEASKALLGPKDERGMIDNMLNAIKGGFPDGKVSANELYDALQGMKISARSQGKASHIQYEQTIRNYIEGLGDNFIGQGNINALNDIATTYEAHVNHAGRKVDPDVMAERKQSAEQNFKDVVGQLAKGVIEFDGEEDFIVDQMLMPNNRQIGETVSDNEATVRDRLGYISEISRGEGDPATGIKVLEDLRDQLLNDPRYESEGFTKNDPWIQKIDEALVSMKEAQNELRSEVSWISEMLESNDEFRADV